jgi:hypothetical protein
MGDDLKGSRFGGNINARLVRGRPRHGDGAPFWRCALIEASASVIEGSA